MGAAGVLPPQPLALDCLVTVFPLVSPALVQSQTYPAGRRQPRVPQQRQVLTVPASVGGDTVLAAGVIAGVGDPGSWVGWVLAQSDRTAAVAASSLFVHQTDQQLRSGASDSATSSQVR